jgi:hypothetical protein
MLTATARHGVKAINESFPMAKANGAIAKAEEKPGPLPRRLGNWERTGSR